MAESEQQCAAQETLLEERAQRIEQLLDLITVLKRKRFRRSADAISPNQLSLFDEAEQLAVTPRQPDVIRVKRTKYTPVDDNLIDAEQGVVIALRAPQNRPKTEATRCRMTECICSVMAIAPIRPWLCKPGSSAMRPAGRIYDASSSRPPRGRKHTAAAHQMVALIRQLYAIERDC